MRPQHDAGVVARRVQHFNDEIEVHDVAMKQLVDDTAPQLVAESGIGYVTAAMFVVAGRAGTMPVRGGLRGSAVSLRSLPTQDRARIVTA